MKLMIIIIPNYIQTIYKSTFYLKVNYKKTQ